MAPEPKSPAPTLRDLAEQLIQDFQRKGRRVDTLKAGLNHILPILGDVPVLDFGEKHYKIYARARNKQVDRRRRRPPQHRVDREIEVIRRVIRFQWQIGEELEQGHSVNATMTVTGLSYRVLRGWEQTEFLPRSIRPIPGSGHPFRTARYSFTDLAALKQAKELRDQGCSKQALVKVAVCLRRRRSYQSNAEAFSKSQPIYDGADVWEITGRAERISCLLQPDATPAPDDETLRGFAESCFIPEELSPPRVSQASHRVYRGQLVKHIFPFFGHMKLTEVRSRRVYEFAQVN